MRRILIIVIIALISLTALTATATAATVTQDRTFVAQDDTIEKLDQDGDVINSYTFSNGQILDTSTIVTGSTDIRSNYVYVALSYQGEVHAINKSDMTHAKMTPTLQPDTTINEASLTIGPSHVYYLDEVNSTLYQLDRDASTIENNVSVGSSYRGVESTSGAIFIYNSSSIEVRSQTDLSTINTYTDSDISTLDALDTTASYAYFAYQDANDDMNLGKLDDTGSLSISSNDIVPAYATQMAAHQGSSGTNVFVADSGGNIGKYNGTLDDQGAYVDSVDFGHMGVSNNYIWAASGSDLKTVDPSDMSLVDTYSKSRSVLSLSTDYTTVEQYDLTVNSSQDNVNIEVKDHDGNTVASGDTGTSQSTTFTLEAGNYDVTASKSGYVSETKSVDLTSSDQAVDFSLETADYNLTVESTPDNATYTIDNDAGSEVANGTTNDTVSLASGDYTINISKFGYMDVTRQITLSSDTTETFDLTVAEWNLTVNSNTTNVSIEVLDSNNNVVANGSTGDDKTIKFENLKEADYTVEASKSGYTTESKSITLSSDQTLNFTLSDDEGGGTPGEDNPIILYVALVFIGIAILAYTSRSDRTSDM